MGRAPVRLAEVYSVFTPTPRSSQLFTFIAPVTWMSTVLSRDLIPENRSGSAEPYLLVKLKGAAVERPTAKRSPIGMAKERLGTTPFCTVSFRFPRPPTGRAAWPGRVIEPFRSDTLSLSVIPWKPT